MSGWMPIPPKPRWWRRAWRWLTTAKCQGCSNRVRIIGAIGARRRESAYCQTCLATFCRTES